MIHSFSSLKLFRQCPRKFYEHKVLKLHPYTESPATAHGNRVHAALEHYLKDRTPIPEDLSNYAWVCTDIIETFSPHALAEVEFAFRRDGTPCAVRDWNNKHFMGKADVLDFLGTHVMVVDYKGFPLDTEIPTPLGFVQMQDIQVGDEVFGRDGSVHHVTGKSEVRNRPYHLQLTFCDGAQVVCDDDHLWLLDDGRVVPASELSKGDCFPLHGTPQYPEAVLPVDPYVLGCWLGDGKHSSGEVSKPDDFIFEEAARRGYPVDMTTGGSRSCPTRTLKGLMSQLRQAGILRNKHIPEAYMRASTAQRLDLLRGICDTDGYANRARKSVVYYSLDEELNTQVQQLAESLGQRVLRPTVPYTGFGKSGTYSPVVFTPRFHNPFLLPRKAEVAAKYVRFPGEGERQAKVHRREISRVERVPPVPSQCISVDSPDHTYLVGRHYIVTHNTGKSSYPDVDQLELMALFAFLKYPTVEVVTGLLFFLDDGVVVPNDGSARWTRADVPTLLATWQAKTDEVERHVATGVWPATPSPLCGWCECTTCPNQAPALAKREAKAARFGK